MQNALLPSESEPASNNIGLKRCPRCPHRLSELWQHVGISNDVFRSEAGFIAGNKLEKGMTEGAATSGNGGLIDAVDGVNRELTREGSPLEIKSSSSSVENAIS